MLDPKFERILQYANIIITELGDQYKYSITGHSLGAFLAELLAIKLQKPAITFDSPGIKPKDNEYCYVTKEELESFPESNITCYVGAPNIVNTCHQHVGNLQMISIPPVKKESSSPFFSEKTLTAVSDAATTSLEYSMPSLSSLKSITHKLGTPKATESAVHAAVESVVDWTFQTLEQHSIDNLARGFDPINEKPYHNIVISQWPCGVEAGVLNNYMGILASNLANKLGIGKLLPWQTVLDATTTSPDNQLQFDYFPQLPICQMAQAHADSSWQKVPAFHILISAALVAMNTILLFLSNYLLPPIYLTLFAIYLGTDLMGKIPSWQNKQSKIICDTTAAERQFFSMALFAQYNDGHLQYLLEESKNLRTGLSKSCQPSSTMQAVYNYFNVPLFLFTALLIAKITHYASSVAFISSCLLLASQRTRQNFFDKPLFDMRQRCDTIQKNFNTFFQYPGTKALTPAGEFLEQFSGSEHIRPLLK